METFSALLALCAGNSPVTGEFPAQRPVTRSFDFFFNWVWINSWVNNGEASDFRRHRAHYDVIETTFTYIRQVEGQDAFHVDGETAEEYVVLELVRDLHQTRTQHSRGGHDFF